ncbi:tRNA (adenosine(37)-N6)-threonylcarbamoyltransferase complex dimerization subunit type 1 TsaB [Acetivibrio cellulolyticus]|uniref:tRNA (adenosine(37)-N6)-threonylcarbamoyltransferase complex dimerization subunit type 1 TsaB n=1 Tax=Acetivibrio cellulolyticus TaxID=35830 RepID=UPI0001E2D12E|nr:tRNA (adenosine(37)-N6)-threonylcarbamoyltransferase complex dimerization subunit type 1 TsaB [Acetivibrio cellulolyticus]
MKVLAIDTSTVVAAVALMDGEKLLGEYSLNNKKTHSQKLMVMVKEILTDLEIKPADIDVFAASIGPGSFTGLRIGVTTAKAMAYATSKPVIGVPTLDALAYNVVTSSLIICPILDARNNQVFTALYETKDNKIERITEYIGVPVSELVQIIKEKNRKVIFTGDAIDLHKDFFISELDGNCEFAPLSVRLQRASSVAEIALKMAKDGKTESSFELVPFYLRKSQAERELEKKLCGKGEK